MGAEYNGQPQTARGGRGEPGAALRERIEFGPPVLLDGALGTELEARGLPCALPLWSTHALVEAPDVVRQIHREYADAGAEILTANTFRTQQHVLARVGLGDRAGSLTTLAVRLARDGAKEAGRRVWVAGSAPPLEDCYRPDLTPDRSTLEAGHQQHARALAEAGVDFILVETHHTLREAEAAARAACETGTPWCVSFVSWEPGRLLSGDRLADAIDAIAPLGPLWIGVNCLPPRAVPAAIDVLRESDRPFGVYANLGAPSGKDRRTDDHAPSAYAEQARRWIDAGAHVVGGCCGTGPAHVRAIAEILVRS